MRKPETVEKLYLDFDGFFASVMQQVMPRLRGKPVGVIPFETSAARRGVSIDGCSIYVTTFPCHNCAKHIIAAGLRRVVYLEPYPKSRADDLYREELICDAADGKARDGKVVFSAYSGVAPRQYGKLFSMSLRGAKSGLDVSKWDVARKSLPPLYVGNFLQAGYIHAERQALVPLDGAGYTWDRAAVCPS